MFQLCFDKDKDKVVWEISMYATAFANALYVLVNISSPQTDAYLPDQD